MSTEPSGSDDRRSILRGVYEENVGIERERRVRRRRAAAEAVGREDAGGLWSLALLAVAFVAMAAVSVGYLVRGPQPSDAAGGAVRTAASPLMTPRRPNVAPSQAALPLAPPPTAVRVAGGAPPRSLADLSLAGLFGLQVRTIVIDPGHGGDKPGAVGPTGLREKHVAFDVARRLRARLTERGGYRVLMTREGDEDISLKERVQFANTHAADLFISIHINWLPVEDVTSVETYYFGTPSDARTLRIARRENRQSDFSVAEFNDMLDEVGQTMRLQESKRLAASIQKSLYRNIHRINPNVDNWGVKTAPFVVLLGVDAPSVLAEIAVISNKAEEEKLRSGAYREQLAAYLESGIVQYLTARTDSAAPAADAASRLARSAPSEN